MSGRYLSERLERGPTTLGAWNTRIWQGQLQLKVAVTLLAFVLVTVFSLVLFENHQSIVIVPALSICFSFLLFCILLDHRVKTGIFGEIGFIFLGFSVAYSVIPALNFLAVDFDFPLNFDGLNFSILNPRPPEIAEHLWRHCLFVVMVIVGYLSGRGVDRKNISERSLAAVDWRVVIALLFLIALCISVVGVLSAPVEDYYAHYTRFDSLSWVEKRIAYASLIIKSGMYYVVLALMFADYRRFRGAIVVFVFAISAYEMVYSLGSRIETLSILLATICLYHFNVRKIRLKDGVICLGGLLILFTAVEFYRTASFDIDSALQDFSEKGLKIATEFGAVFYTSFHLYFERLNGTMPDHEWPMLINDFLTVVPFFEHTEFNSQYWYARIFFPDAIVPPQTMGPIADSAIWGGELDLAVRGLLTGLGFGWLVRWALRSRDRLFAYVAYVFLFATSVVTLKYSLPYQISQMLRTIIPSVLLCYVAIKFLKLFTIRSSLIDRKLFEMGLASRLPGKFK